MDRISISCSLTEKMKTCDDSEDGETGLSITVTEYLLVDKEEQPICFSFLPIRWSENESLDAPGSLVYLHGRVDDGLQRIYKQVVAWKVDIQNIHPKVWVLSKDQKWFKIMKPRKAYEATVRSILVTLQCLCYLRRNPNSSDRSLWENVDSTFRHLEVGVSKGDLLKHLTFVKMMLERYEELSRSVLLSNYLMDLPRLCHSKKKLQKVDFIVDDDDYDEYDDSATNSSYEDSGDEDKDDCFDTVCAICDDGGEILCCEGKCLRSFHATRDAAGPDSCCKTLGYTRAQVEEMPNFLCPNCLFKKHQCFACGRLGNSDAPNAEVYRCISASCGHYYHPRCAATQIYPKNKDQAADLEKKIACGEPFTCSAHKCMVCNQVENKKVTELQFAMCRRCPKSFHRKCLPRDISLEDRPEEGIKQRAWDGLIPNRILIYCRKHVINESIGTPARDHIVFPHAIESGVVDHSDSLRVKVLGKRKLETSSRERSDKRLTETVRRVSSNEVARGKSFSGSVHTVSSKALSESCRKKGFAPERKNPLRDERISSSEMNNLTVPNSENKDIGSVSHSNIKINNTLVPANKEAKKRIMQFVENTPATSKSVEISLKKKSAQNNAFHVDKKITQGKVEGSVEAIRAALKKLENGCSIEDAKAVCGPDVLKQVLRWKIVERLHWYVRGNDMIVDFCCGANDFSQLMRKKLEESGKRCSFKNYDIFPPVNDFNFEKRDWMTVHPRELPPGTQLIMGLNPPFGVRAALANKFIDKALEFKPKLIILIVPKETERLDRKPDGYDLIWEDETILSGKSFYLPGSIDAKDKQMDQWNVKPPSLYLWSRPDWTPVHRDIALKLGHVIPGPDSSWPNIQAHHQITPSEQQHLISRMHTSPHEIGYYQHSVDPLAGNFYGKEMVGSLGFFNQNQISSLVPPKIALAPSHFGHEWHGSEHRPLPPSCEPMARHSAENSAWPTYFATSDGGWLDD